MQYFELLLHDQIREKSFSVLFAEHQAQASVRGRRGIKSVRAATVLADPVDDPVALLCVMQGQRESTFGMAADVCGFFHLLGLFLWAIVRQYDYQIKARCEVKCYTRRYTPRITSKSLVLMDKRVKIEDI
jgi:hypothetical protein